MHLNHSSDVSETFTTNHARSPRPHVGVVGSDHVLITDARSAEGSLKVRVSSGLRRVPASQMRRLIPRISPPQAGDIVLARVEKIGKNTRIELPSGRAQTLHVGDALAVVFGNRYATAQFEGYAQADGDMCDMLSMGGLCGKVVSSHAKMNAPTKLRLLGSIADCEGRSLHLRDFAVLPARASTRPHVTVVCGTTMDSGKTHTAVSIIRGFKLAGHAVAAIKLTGTACCRDTWKMHDAGAAPVLDFVDGGYPSTYLCCLQELMGLFELLLNNAELANVRHVVVEIADGLLQIETAALLGHPSFRDKVDAWVLAACDPLAVVGSIAVLRKAGIQPVAVSGLLTCSHLAMREAESAVDIRCLSAEALEQGALNEILAPQAQVARHKLQEALA